MIEFLVEIRTDKNQHQIQQIWIRLGTKFHFRQKILFWGSNLTKKYIYRLKGANKLYHRIQKFGISLDTYFHLKLTILIFWTKFAQKDIFCPK